MAYLNARPATDEQMEQVHALVVDGTIDAGTLYAFLNGIQIKPRAQRYLDELEDISVKLDIVVKLFESPSGFMLGGGEGTKMVFDVVYLLDGWAGLIEVKRLDLVIYVPTGTAAEMRVTAAREFADVIAFEAREELSAR